MIKATDLRHGRYSVFNLHVHLVLVTKYRKTIFNSSRLAELKSILSRVCLNFEADPVEFNGQVSKGCPVVGCVFSCRAKRLLPTSALESKLLGRLRWRGSISYHQAIYSEPSGTEPFISGVKARSFLDPIGNEMASVQRQWAVPSGLNVMVCVCIVSIVG